MMGNEARKKPLLSVIIPAFHENEILAVTLDRLNAYLSKQGYHSEIIVVLDGASPQTIAAAQGFLPTEPVYRILNNRRNRGKGFSVRRGLLHADGRYRLFADGDGATSFGHIGDFLHQLHDGYDMAIGSRKAPGSVILNRQSRFREISGDFGNRMIRKALNLDEFRDTQCGFKMMTEKFAESIVDKMKIDRFGFDFEMILLAKHRGFRILSMPVFWRHHERSSVRLFGPNGYFRTLFDLIQIRNRLKPNFHRTD